MLILGLGQLEKEILIISSFVNADMRLAESRSRDQVTNFNCCDIV